MLHPFHNKWKCISIYLPLVSCPAFQYSWDLPKMHCSGPNLFRHGCNEFQLLGPQPIDYNQIKTPERWRALPRHALLVTILAQKLSDDVKTSRRDVTTSHCDVILCHLSRQNGSVEFTQVTPLGSPKITFFKMATLTFDLWPWPSNSTEIWQAMFTPNFRSVRQTVQTGERQWTDTQTGPILYPRPLTREGKISSSALRRFELSFSTLLINPHCFKDALFIWVFYTHFTDNIYKV